ncbi:MAG: LysR family transcriptional regulator [Solobacterium sp.]|nr:LysR family transcriptional regulator [Solobacterium sp.]
MKFRDIDYLLALDKNRSIKEAAKELYVDPSTLSKFLSNLEEEVNTPLFIRSGHKIEPTESGRIYITFARETKERLKETQKKIHRNNLRSTLRIGVPINLTPVLSEAIIRFQRENPHVYIELFEDIFPNLESAVEHNLVDLTILPNKVEGYSFYSEKLFDEEVFVVLPTRIKPFIQYHDGEYNHIDLKTLEHENYVIPYENTEFLLQINKIFKQLDFSPSNWLYTKSHSSVFLNLREYGPAFVIMPYPFLKKNYSFYKNTLYRFTEEAIRIPCYCLMNQHALRGGNEQKFLKILKETL